MIHVNFLMKSFVKTAIFILSFGATFIGSGFIGSGFTQNLDHSGIKRVNLYSQSQVPKNNILLEIRTKNESLVDKFHSLVETPEILNQAGFCQTETSQVGFTSFFKDQRDIPSPLRDSNDSFLFCFQKNTLSQSEHGRKSNDLLFSIANIVQELDIPFKIDSNSTEYHALYTQVSCQCPF